MKVEVNGKSNELAARGYAYLPQGLPHRVVGTNSSRLAVIEKPYQALDSVEPPSFIVSSEDAVASHPLDDDPSLQVKCLLPDEMNFDFAVNTMVYQPGAALSMVEMHVMEHGLMMLEGGGIYRLGDSWYPVTAGDFIWMGPWCPQWFGAIGKAPAKYLIYKDFHRHPWAESAAMNLEIDRDRLLSEIEALASFSDAEAPAVTRIVFTPADLKARAWMKARCEEAGLTVRYDAIGNTFARWNGLDPSAPVVGTGSHIDAIPNAGKYDGVVGVLGGLEAIRALQRCGFRPKHSIELLIFTAEEPTRFGIGCLGSRLLSGTLSPDAARKLTDKDGVVSRRSSRPCRFRRRTRRSEVAGQLLQSVRRIAY